MYLDSNGEHLLRQAALRGRRAAPETAIILITCVKDLTRVRGDYSNYSITTSFFSAEELSAVIAALRRLRFYVEHFHDEVDFTRWVIEGGLRSLHKANKLVYFCSTNGTDLGRRCFIPAFCTLEAIQTLNSDTYASAISRHKFHWTTLLGSFGVRVPKSWLYEPSKKWFEGREPAPGTRVIAKALHEDSSIGVSRDGVGHWSPGMSQHVAQLASDLDQPIMVQSLIEGTEVEVPVLEFGATRVAIPVEVLNSKGASLAADVLTYDEVWDDRYRYGAEGTLGSALKTQLRDTASHVCDLLNFRFFSRIDFRVDEKGHEYVIDVSATPHLTPHSAFGHLFKALGLEYSDVLAALVGGAKLAMPTVQSADQY